MIPESIPIVIDLPQFDEIEIYPIHDLHYGDENFDSHKWNELTKLILSKPNALVAFVGDLMQAAIPNSKSDMFSQKATLREQQDFVTSIFKQFADRIAVIVDGNHEDRCARTCGLFPLFTSACLASVEDKYRSTHAVVALK